MTDHPCEDCSGDLPGTSSGTQPRGSPVKGISSAETSVSIMAYRRFGELDGDWVVIMDCDLQDRPEEIPVSMPKPRRLRHVLARREKEGFASEKSLRLTRLQLFHQPEIRWSGRQLQHHLRHAVANWQACANSSDFRRSNQLDRISTASIDVRHAERTRASRLIHTASYGTWQSNNYRVF